MVHMAWLNSHLQGKASSYAQPFPWSWGSCLTSPKTHVHQLTPNLFPKCPRNRHWEQEQYPHRVGWGPARQPVAWGAAAPRCHPEAFLGPQTKPWQSTFPNKV